MNSHLTIDTLSASKKRKRWTEEEHNFLVENLTVLTISEIARELDRTERAIKLYMHFRRIQVGEPTHKNLLIKMLIKRFVKAENFTPNKAFFQAVEIKQKRFWQLYRGERALKEKEIKALVNYFELSPKDMIEIRQMKIDFLED